MGPEDVAGVQQEQQVEQVQCKKDAAVQRRQVELQECESDLAFAQLGKETLRHEQEVEVARLQEGLARQQTQLSDTLEDLPGSHQHTEKAVEQMEQTQHEKQVAAAAQVVGEEAEEKSENTQLEKEPVQQELQAELQRVQAELARTWMDLQKCRADLVMAENELTEKDVDIQDLRKELRTCKEDLARMRREKEQLQREKKEDLAKVPTPFSYTSREKQPAARQTQEELAKERTRFSELTQRAQEEFEKERTQFLNTLRKKELELQHAQDELAWLQKSTPAVGQTCHVQLTDETWTSFRLPSHWIAQGGDVLRQISQRVRKVDPDKSWFSRLRLAEPEPRLTFETVAQRIRDRENLEKFTKLLRDSVFHHDDRMFPFAHTTCNSLKDQIEVYEAYHIENVSLYEAYQDRCKRLQLKHCEDGIVPEPISLDPNSALTELAQQMGIQMSAPNERLLFHGTPSYAAEKIALEGFSMDRAKLGMYGRGLYFADQSCKSHQYSGWSWGLRQRLHTMVIARVALGDPYYCQQSDRANSRPPSKLPGGPCCDCVIAKPGRMPGHYAGHQNHAEFVVFEQKQVYPEYILKYRLRRV